MAWLIERLEAGFADVSNPRNVSQVRRVSLVPADASAIVLWSKDYAEFIAEYERPESPLHRYDAFVFQFTLNSESLEGELLAHARGSAFLEPGLRTTLDQRLAQVAWFAAHPRLRPGIAIRFDPIVQYRIGAGPLRNNLDSFDKILRFLSVLRIPFITVAFAIQFPRVKTRLRAYNARLPANLRIAFVDYSLEEKHAIITTMRDRACEYAASPELAVQIRTCCPTGDFSDIEDVAQGACVDAAQIGACLSAADRPALPRGAGTKDAGQRETCKCVKSAEIGDYAGCRHSCIYCYANAEPLCDADFERVSAALTAIAAEPTQDEAPAP
jgi:hypothetical protein